MTKGLFYVITNIPNEKEIGTLVMSSNLVI